MRQENAPNRQVVSGTYVLRHPKAHRTFLYIYFKTEDGFIRVYPKEGGSFGASLIFEPPPDANYHNGYFSDWTELEQVEEALQKIGYQFVGVTREDSQAPPRFEVRKIIEEAILILPCYCDGMIEYRSNFTQENFPIIPLEGNWLVKTSIEPSFSLKNCPFCGKRALKL